jgi:tetratricopeptide (TPR) repeat protein
MLAVLLALFVWTEPTPLASQAKATPVSHEELKRLRAQTSAATAEDAYEAWKRLADAEPASGTAACALLEMATIRERQRRPGEAAVLFARARDTDSRVAPDAQWRYGLALFQTGDYAGALEAFRRGQKGLARAALGVNYESEYALWEGLALEHLGRMEDAVGNYVYLLADTRVMSHLLDLYEAVGQIDDLERIVAEQAPESADGYFDAAPALTLVVMRRMARTGEWASLVPILEPSTQDRPQAPSLYSAHDTLAAEGVHLLTRSCDKTVPLLVPLAASSSFGSPWATQALGICATPEAVASLREIARDRRSSAQGVAWLALTTSERGKAELRALGLPETPRTSMVVSETGRPNVTFPPAQGTRLPSHPTVPDHALVYPRDGVVNECSY